MKSRKKLYIVTVFILILIFVLSLLIETLSLKSLTEDDYNSLIDYSDYIVRTTYLKEDVQTPNWNYINNVKVVIKNNFDDDEEEKSRKSTIEISLSLPKHCQELTVTYPYTLTKKNELIIGIDYKYVEKHFNNLELVTLSVLICAFLVTVFGIFSILKLKKKNKI